ncbi:nucleoside triphosphate pyrophosphohydrolase [Streptomyces sedi]|uniref:Nucleoside triphosphate pyrophosphohydrolase n=1 Tax=Streptomyces sedi TaxID=555059 RepID=A0A5C4UUI1_9ACTN|nr:nucleoside triphosphate pyrophosphohydrolase [Streptomyces sedi]TNM26609.1 nucleoside triphosphate pyrophosphohydrolase [Streptomyces sedi]
MTVRELNGAPGRIVLLTTSHRVAPGLLSWPAWQVLHEADLVVCREAEHPHGPYLREAGVTVRQGVPSAAELVSACAGGRTAVVIAGAEGEPRLTDELARLAGSGRSAVLPELELLPGSYDLPGARLLDLVRVMDEIRAHCPWASIQTSEDLTPYGVEEVYELVEAVENGDRTEIREELGDVLLQVVFHARIAAEDLDEPFDIDDVAGTIVTKLIRRHPHIFGDAKAETPEDVKALWFQVKAEEKARTSVTEGVPLGQPALALAAKLAGRARRTGLSVPLPETPHDGGFGYRLLSLAAEAEEAGVNPETALRAAARAYRDTIISSGG